MKRIGICLVLLLTFFCDAGASERESAGKWLWEALFRGETLHYEYMFELEADENTWNDLGTGMSLPMINQFLEDMKYAFDLTLLENGAELRVTANIMDQEVWADLFLDKEGVSCVLSTDVTTEIYCTWEDVINSSTVGMDEKENAIKGFQLLFGEIESRETVNALFQGVQDGFAEVPTVFQNIFQSWLNELSTIGLQINRPVEDLPTVRTLHVTNITAKDLYKLIVILQQYNPAVSWEEIEQLYGEIDDLTDIVTVYYGETNGSVPAYLIIRDRMMDYDKLDYLRAVGVSKNLQGDEHWTIVSPFLGMLGGMLEIEVDRNIWDQDNFGIRGTYSLDNYLLDLGLDIQDTDKGNSQYERKQDLNLLARIPNEGMDSVRVSLGLNNTNTFEDNTAREKLRLKTDLKMNGITYNLQLSRDAMVEKYLDGYLAGETAIFAQSAQYPNMTGVCRAIIETRETGPERPVTSNRIAFIRDKAAFETYINQTQMYLANQFGLIQ